VAAVPGLSSEPRSTHADKARRRTTGPPTRRASGGVPFRLSARTSSGSRTREPMPAALPTALLAVRPHEAGRRRAAHRRQRRGAALAPDGEAGQDQVGREART